MLQCSLTSLVSSQSSTLIEICDWKPQQFIRERTKMPFFLATLGRPDSNRVGCSQHRGWNSLALWPAICCYQGTPDFGGDDDTQDARGADFPITLSPLYRRRDKHESTMQRKPPSMARIRLLAPRVAAHLGIRLHLTARQPPARGSSFL